MSQHWLVLRDSREQEGDSSTNLEKTMWASLEGGQVGRCEL